MHSHVLLLIMTSVYSLLSYESSSILVVGILNPTGPPGFRDVSARSALPDDVLLILKNDALAAVLEEPMNISTNSAVICWQKPVADSQVKLYTLKVEIDSGDISSSGGNTVFSADVPAGKNEDRFCQSVDNLEEDTKYVYTVIAVHINGLAIQNVDRGAFKTKANCKYFCKIERFLPLNGIKIKLCCCLQLIFSSCSNFYKANTISLIFKVTQNIQGIALIRAVLF